MSDIRVASRYAKSLLDLAQENGVLDEVNDDMVLLGKVADSNHALVLMLRNPIIFHDKKHAILKQIFEGKVNPLTMAIFKIIVKKHREPALVEVARAFQQQYNIVKSIKIATVITAVPLSNDQRKQFIAIVEKETGMKVILKEEVDSDLIGGYILKVGDRQINASISSKLHEIRKQFTNNTYSATV